MLYIFGLICFNEELTSHATDLSVIIHCDRYLAVTTYFADEHWHVLYVQSRPLEESHSVVVAHELPLDFFGSQVWFKLQ